MRAALVHRGPDEGSTDVMERCALGHQRLRVLDLEAGSQPVSNERGDVVAVFNGELYNFPELREELARGGHAVRGTGDTPVIPHLYEEHGVGFVERLEGMFALALWDRARGRLVLARDRVGKKPLVWARLPDGTVAFASELKALLTLPGLAPEPDLAALDAYLALGYVPGERTGLKGVHRLRPGHLLVFENGSERLERYWQLEQVAQSHKVDDQEWLERVRSTVAAAVVRRLAADVPLGALLSGGIDSSVVVALMAQSSTGPVRTFTVGFPDVRYDERDFARAVAERYGTVHEEVVLEPDAAETLPRLAAAFDEPLGDEAALPTFLICDQARKHVTVALTGDGGDESFAGYERYLVPGLARRAAAIPGAASLGARTLRALPSGRREPRSRAFRAARFLETAAAPAAERYARTLEVFPPLLRRELWAADVASVSAAELLGAPPADGIAGLQLLDVATYLAGDLLPKADIASMAHSLELRSPLLDREVLELGVSLPDSLKTRGRQGKVALRKAFANELPPEVASRGKTGFGVPIGRWFRGELRSLAHDVLLGDRGLFRRSSLERLLDEHETGARDHAHRLWCLVMLELWLRTHVEARPAPTATLVRS
jgi:asparagine synthase (glutamine-hydrolysing)